MLVEATGAGATLFCHVQRSENSWSDDMHAPCVGVADPTGRFQKGSVFVTGLNRGENRQ